MYNEMPVHCTQELVNACKIEVNDVDCGNTGSFQLDRKVQTFVGFFSCIIDVIDLGLMNYLHWFIVNYYRFKMLLPPFQINNYELL